MKWTASLAALGAIVAAQPAQAKLSDAQIRQRIVQESIDSYPGNCPGPYDTDRAGRRCGKRSAYSRPGGYAPKCFPSDVSDLEVRAHRARH
jgi:hypothetical protein